MDRKDIVLEEHEPEADDIELSELLIEEICVWALKLADEVMERANLR